MKNILWILLFISFQSYGQRTVISLNGVWDIEESIKPDAAPRKYYHTVAVPGLANQSRPVFPDVDKFTTIDVLRHPIVGIKDNPLLDTNRLGIVGQNRNFFWYRRMFEFKEQNEIVILKINKAQFGTRLWINGKYAGEHFGCFTAGYFDITRFVKPGKNEILIRIGAHPKALPEWVPYGTDFEKRKWTPGIYDDVSVIACNNPYIETIQIAPDINKSAITVQTKVINYKQDGKFNISYKVREWKNGKHVSASEKSFELKQNESVVLNEIIDIPDQHLWSPDDPFLYILDASTGGDNMNSRFGMREFHFDTKTKRAYLNNKIIFLRGSNIVLHIFFEDSLCLDNPWNEKWVRRLLSDIPKEMHWNSFRFCLGPVPDKWLEIADETGLLIQYEYYIWSYKDYWKVEELEGQISEWMHDSWNHPSVVIWDIQNETRWDKLEEIINKSRVLDLSNRQWENGYSRPAGENDPVEDHNYLSYNDPEGKGISRWRMPVYENGNGTKGTNSFHPATHAAVLNEYAWMWLRRDGTPTILSKDFYDQIAPGCTSLERQELYGYFLAGETEYFRAFRNYAGVQFFVYLIADYPTAFTGDLFEDVHNLKLNPVYEKYVKEAFKPLGVYLHFWMAEIPVKDNNRGRFPVILINDEYRTLKGKLELRIEKPDGQLVKTAEKPFKISELIADTYLIDCDYPAEPGEYIIKAIVHPEDYEPKTTTSTRYLKMLPAGTGNMPITTPLKALSSNPNYFTGGAGRAVYLTGSQTWNTVQDWGTNDSIQPLDFDAFVKFLSAHKHNFTLLWTTELPTFRGLPTTAASPPDFTVTPFPWQRTGPGKASDGKPKFDLKKFNQEYFDRLRTRVKKLNEAGIYAGVYPFSGEWILRFRFPGDGYPFTGSNNTNGIDDGGGMGSVTMTGPDEITAIQDVYMQKIISTLNDLPNVLWIVSQESPGASGWWNSHLIEYIRATESRLPIQHPIGIGPLDGDLKDSLIINSDADWIAPGSRISPVRTIGTGNPSRKVNINDSDHSYWEIWNDTPQANRNFFWLNFTQGNQTLFMDPYVLYYPRESRNYPQFPRDGIGSGPDLRWENVRNTMGYIRSYADRMNLVSMTPQAILSSTGHVLANTGSAEAELLIYAPSGGSFTVDLTGIKGQFSSEWMNPATGVKTNGEKVYGMGVRTFNPPFSGDAVLYLKRSE